MKKIICILLAVFFVGMTFVGCADTKTDGDKTTVATKQLRVGMECAYAPFNWTQSDDSNGAVAIQGGGYANGYDVQIAKKIAAGLDRELVIVKTEWDGLVPSLTSGTIDAIIAGMSPTDDRKLTIDFSDNYYTSDLVIVVRKDGPFKDAKVLDDFAGAKITGQQSTFHYTVIDQIKDVKKQTAMPDFATMITALSSGTIDGYISERPGAISAMASNPELSFVSFEAGKGFVASDSDVAIAIGLKKGSALADDINKTLASISQNDRQTLMDTALANQPVSSD